MVSVSEAFELITRYSEKLESEIIPLREALDRVLAEPILSPIDMPPFRQSAMDGYAVSGTAMIGSSFKIVAEIKAGDDASKIFLAQGEAARIFTGAMVPQSANCVVRQEGTERQSEIITLTEEHKPGQNIRPVAEQIEKGARAAEAGISLNAGVLSYLAGLGIVEVCVTRQPKIRIIVTGNELVKAGTTLSPGQIYESNGIMLQSLLRSYHFDASFVHVQDDYESTVKQIKELLFDSDILLLSGVISVGDYDFVGKALAELDVYTIFYKVKQKPGKPVFFGKHSRCHVFALPGNPASAHACFHLYVLYSLQLLLARKSPYLPLLAGEMKDVYQKKTGITHILKAKVTIDGISLVQGQSSAMLSAFTEANALVIVPESTEVIRSGDSLDYYLLRQ